MNFEDVREYQPGDEIRAIDWNVTARLGNAFVKKFTEERELTVMLVVDVSASGNFGSTTQSKRELAAEVACLLAFSAIRNNDKVGLLLFTDRVELFIPPKKGRSHTLRIIREILFFEPQGRGTEPGLALDYLNKIVTRRAVVFFISDFQAPDFSRALAVSGRRHDFIAIQIRDERERSLPNVGDRKSTRLNSSHLVISFAVFCLIKKDATRLRTTRTDRDGQPSIRPRCFSGSCRYSDSGATSSLSALSHSPAPRTLTAARSATSF